MFAFMSISADHGTIIIIMYECVLPSLMPLLLAAFAGAWSLILLQLHEAEALGSYDCTAMHEMSPPPLKNKALHARCHFLVYARDNATMCSISFNVDHAQNALGKYGHRTRTHYLQHLPAGFVRFVCLCRKMVTNSFYECYCAM